MFIDLNCFSRFSPFVKEKPGDYIPVERIEELRIIGKGLWHLGISIRELISELLTFHGSSFFK